MKLKKKKNKLETRKTCSTFKNELNLDLLLFLGFD
jgi:hypothetical protein